VKILLDENLPEGLIEPLRRLGHAVDSVGSLKLKGLDNGRLYREVAAAYELFFTKDREFAARVSALTDPNPVKIVLTSIRQQPEPDFVAAFIHAFVITDWSAAGIVVDGWPIS
jgi:predicted nuclease of predicted toxin-antitoxin system